jgi:hypothetical protein
MISPDECSYFFTGHDPTEVPVFIIKTIIGRLFSIQSVNAVISITRRFLVIFLNVILSNFVAVESFPDRL